MTFDHWQRLVAVARADQTATDLPGRISARCTGPVAQVGRLATPDGS
jgi:hypothetical protein